MEEIEGLTMCRNRLRGLHCYGSHGPKTAAFAGVEIGIYRKRTRLEMMESSKEVVLGKVVEIGAESPIFRERA